MPYTISKRRDEWLYARLKDCYLRQIDDNFKHHMRVHSCTVLLRWSVFRDQKSWSIVMLLYVHCASFVGGNCKFILEMSSYSFCFIRSSSSDVNSGFACAIDKHHLNGGLLDWIITSLVCKLVDIAPNRLKTCTIFVANLVLFIGAEVCLRFVTIRH